jgi:hypothetical protein
MKVGKGICAFRTQLSYYITAPLAVSLIYGFGYKTGMMEVMSFHLNSWSTAAPALLLSSSEFGLKKRWCASKSIISLAH